MYPRFLFIALFAFALSLFGSTAFAAPKSFGKADAAWHRGELEEAQKLYQEALDAGGLEPEEVVIAYSRIGTVKAALKDKAGALSDFRVASVVDPNFELPADSGPVARKLYAQAKSEAGEQGEKLSLNISAPEEIPANQAFVIETEIPEGFSVFVTRVVVTIEDTLTGKKWRKKLDSSGKLTFKFPPKVAERGARLKVRVAGMDSKDNAWVAESLKIKVEGERSTGAAPASGSWGKEDPFANKKKDKKKDEGGIFSGPVPWIAGGVAIVATAAVVFFATRPSDDVSVGAPAWQ
ncbi:MAG: tetratricopeptide repeat protein [Polyangiaceae bacterium]|nr:tetratricopeptide repeat protein [Myxococcales bacterium]MCB9590062.1 tetratricopeptide repeat protein [Polyangiaceae bacterium]